jgi:hypothetical protein
MTQKYHWRTFLANLIRICVYLTTLSVAKIIQRQMTDYLMDCLMSCKEYGKKQSSINFRFYPNIFLEWLGKKEKPQWGLSVSGPKFEPRTSRIWMLSTRPWILIRGTKVTQKSNICSFYRCLSSGMLHGVVSHKTTEVSEMLTLSIIRPITVVEAVRASETAVNS